MYDVLIIGCGITGAATAFALSKFQLKTAILERENDVATGTTKANSAILHAGFDPIPGSLMARLNVKGVAMAEELCRALDVPYDRCGALVLAFSPKEVPVLEGLLERGKQNGVPGLALLSGEEARALEPHLSDRVVAALYRKLAKPGDTDIDVSDCPDLLPPLAVMASARQGTTRFVNAARLRIKESDRLATTAAALNALGVPAEDGPDSLTVCGVSTFSGGTVDGANDHRIVMAAAVAASRALAPVTILGAEAVKKSYPSFWEDYKKLGGVFDVL